LQLFSFCGYGLALAALALVVFGAYDSYPKTFSVFQIVTIFLNKVNSCRFRIYSRENASIAQIDFVDIGRRKTCRRPIRAKSPRFICA